ncbi:hypothetical protein QR98_0044880 [Sarcoptes scabiei]|uniref:Uncharacterized protein n=1 Tax=Sarcoptes scabiei TaxID=52283 RepID=A0A132A5W4_SARSC|nr:hypothetical protein QR98_0044880 [Sarcoptes scabiei]
MLHQVSKKAFGGRKKYWFSEGSLTEFNIGHNLQSIKTSPPKLTEIGGQPSDQQVTNKQSH